jgi:hypothetical protein
MPDRFRGLSAWVDDDTRDYLRTVKGEGSLAGESERMRSTQITANSGSHPNTFRDHSSPQTSLITPKGVSMTLPKPHPNPIASEETVAAL